MNKNAVSIVESSFSKIASRAWKKKLGELGEGSVDKLLDSGVFNRAKELKGLNIGTNKILQKHNAKNVKNINKASSHIMQRTKEMTPKVFEDNPMFTPKEIYSATKDSLKNMKLLGSPMAGHSKWNKSGITNVPGRHANKQVTEVANGLASQYRDYGLDSKNLPKFKRKDREGKKWADAILSRHEADEVRHGSKVFKNKKKFGDLGNGPQPYTQLGGHLTPKVLSSESANVALAPKSTKNYFKSLRSLGVEGNTEIDALKQYSGLNYGKSGVYNKSKASKGENSIAKLVRQNLQGM